MLPKPTNPADPVNEPCYSRESCRGYDPATGPTDVRPAICCVKVGTCDGPTLTRSAHYYEGGCRPFFTGNKSDGTPYTYYVDRYWNVLANTSTSTNFPTSTYGCVKQGECALPHVEQIRGYTSRGSPNLEMGALSDETMGRLLANAIEAYPDACRDADLYPHPIMGCRYYVGLRSSPVSGYHCDCTMSNDYETLCAAKRRSSWTECSTEASHTGCDAPPSAELIAARLADAPPSPPPPPPSPPSTPPAPPQKCIPQVRYRTNPLPSHALTPTC